LKPPTQEGSSTPVDDKHDADEPNTLEDIGMDLSNQQGSDGVSGDGNF